MSFFTNGSFLITYIFGYAVIAGGLTYGFGMMLRPLRLSQNWSGKVLLSVLFVLLGVVTLFLASSQLESTGFAARSRHEDFAALTLGLLGVGLAIMHLFSRFRFISNVVAIAYLILLDVYLFGSTL